MPRDRVRILPERAVLTEDEAAARLASMPKPIVCDPYLVDGVLEISCEPVTPEYEDDLRDQRLQIRRGELFSADERARMHTSNTAAVLLIGRGASVLLDVHGYEMMWSDYVLTGYFCIPKSPEQEPATDVDVVAAREFAPCTSPTIVAIRQG